MNLDIDITLIISVIFIVIIENIITNIVNVAFIIDVDII